MQHLGWRHGSGVNLLRKSKFEFRFLFACRREETVLFFQILREKWFVRDLRDQMLKSVFHFTFEQYRVIRSDV